MGRSVQEKKGYNVYQARLYTITDELALKECYIEEENAKNALLGYFKEEHEGPLYVRAVIRCIDPVLKAWIVPWSIDNPSALLLDEENTLVVRWRITLYNMGDEVITSQESTVGISEKKVRVLMLSVNAFYAVVSCQDASMRDRFIVSRTYRNQMFNLHVTDFDPEQLEKQKQEPLEMCYEKLLRQDAEETARINAERAERK